MRIHDYTDLRAFARDELDMEPHIDTLIRLAREARTIVEWGVRHGVSTWALLDGLPEDGRLFSVDIVERAVPLRVANDPRWTFILGNDTDPALRPLLPEQADIVFIDTSHTYEQTVAELAAALDYNPSRIVMHDYVMEPVARAASEFCAREGWRLVANELPFGLATLEPGIRR
jgi:predicted O-methyltransferase YrrM